MPRPARPGHRHHARLAAAVLACTVAASTTAAALSEQEQRARILFESREEEARYEQQGVLVGDPALDAYLQDVMDRLYPELHGTTLVRAVRSTEFNAFAVASGHVYVYVGALLRLNNEAELAAVLGHEGGHLLGDHLYRGVLESKAIGRRGAVLDALFGPGMGKLTTRSTMAGFSRELESDADRAGFERMRLAGYAPTAAAAVFERMAREIAARQLKEPPYFYADHPKLLERAANFKRFAAGANDGDTRAEQFLQATQTVRSHALWAVYEHKDALALLALLGEAGRPEQFAPAGEFLLGEGFRLRAATGDDELALAHYDRAIAQYPEFAPAYAARGRLHDRRGARAQALADLEHYLEFAPEDREAAFARQRVTRLRQELLP